MSIPITEQETIIHMSRDNDIVTVWTNDSVMMTRLDKLITGNGIWSVKEQYGQDKSLYAKEYKAPKSLISFRSHKIKRTLTDEQKKAFRDRMNNYQKNKVLKQNT